MIREFRQTCLKIFFGDIDPTTPEQREERFAPRSIRDIAEMTLQQNYRPIDYVARLLNTPRVLRSAFAKTLRVWEELHGEIDFDDVLVVSVLEAAAPKTSAFLVEKSHQLQVLANAGNSGGEDTDKSREELLENWKRMRANEGPDSEAEAGLIDFLFPGWRRREAKSRLPLQGVAVVTPTNYWRRLNAEAIADNELRDQVVTRRIIQLNSDNSNGEKRALLDSTANDVLNKVMFAEKLEQFGTGLHADVVLEVISAYFTILLQSKVERLPRGIGLSTREYPGFVELFRMSLDNPSEQHDEWVILEIARILPDDLRLANDVYDFFRASTRSEIKAKARHPNIRTAAVECARDLFSGNPQGFIWALRNSHFWTLYHFVIHFDTKNGGGEGFDMSRWEWLGDVLFGALEMREDIVLPQVVALLFSGTRDKYTFKAEKSQFERAYQFDEELGRFLFGERLDDVMIILAEHVAIENGVEEDARIMSAAKSIAANWLSRK
jgi:hypothetical protein